MSPKVVDQPEKMSAWSDSVLAADTKKAGIASDYYYY